MPLLSTLQVTVMSQEAIINCMEEMTAAERLEMSQKSDRCRDIMDGIDFLKGRIETEVLITPTREEVSNMTDLQLVNLMSKMPRSQKQDMAAVPRCRRILNTVRRLNRWITSENLDELAQDCCWFDGGLATEASLKQQVCRVCGRSSYALLMGDGVPSNSGIDAAKERLSAHMRADHPETWRLISYNLNSNKLPFI